MNLESSLDFFINQGPVFWAATASVGTGGALLIAAFYVYMRRLAANDRFNLKKLRVSRAQAVIPVATPEIRVTDAGYTLASGPAPAETRKIQSVTPLASLLERLRMTGDRLESALADGGAAGLPHSTLKTYLNAVEHDSKAGIG